jgi:hypothetical protein
VKSRHRHHVWTKPPGPGRPSSRPELIRGLTLTRWRDGRTYLWVGREKADRTRRGLAWPALRLRGVSGPGAGDRLAAVPGARLVWVAALLLGGASGCGSGSAPPSAGPGGTGGVADAPAGGQAGADAPGGGTGGGPPDSQRDLGGGGGPDQSPGAPDGACPPSKANNGIGCASDNDCCSGHCGSRRTPPQLVCCAAGRQSCLISSDCCAGRCEGPFGSGTCCDTLGTICSASQDPSCCGKLACCAGATCGLVYGSAGSPRGVGCCVAPGNACVVDTDCCNGTTTFIPSQCFRSRCCYSIQSPCTKDSDCCGGGCINGQCG